MMKAILGCVVLGACLFFPAIGKTEPTYQLVCDRPIFDFGPVDQSAVITNVFVVRNEGDVTFPLKYIRTSCSCTKGRMDQRMIAPGETANVTVVYKARDRRGVQNKKLWMMPMNTNRPALVLTMKGFVDVP